MLNSQVLTLAPANNGFYPLNTNYANNFNSQLPCQMQSYPVQYVLPQTFCQIPQFSQLFCPSPVQFPQTCPSPVHYPQTCPSPVQFSQNCPSPVQFSQNCSSPVQFPTSLLSFSTPSPSPPRYDMSLPNMELGSPPRFTEQRSVSLGGAGSQSSDGNSMLREFYCFNVVKQKATIGEMRNMYEEQLVKAMKNALQLPSVNFSIQLNPSKKNKSITIRWILNQEKFNYSTLKQRTVRKDFEKKLICELAKIDGGSFNAYLSGAKQLTIINEGWSCLLKLKDSLISRNGTLGSLLAVPEDERFEEEAIKNLYKVSEDEKGMALRGPTVVGVRFKLQTDILKMPRFVEKVQTFIGVQRSTMIASLKTHKQYKGWSVYLDVGCVENVKLVEVIAKKFGFEKTKVFVAEDNF